MAKTIDLLLGSDHRGAELKQEIMDWVLLDKEEIEFEIMMSIIHTDLISGNV